MYTDIAEITPVVYDRKFGTSTSGTPYEVQARVEEETKSQSGPQGVPDEYIGLYILPPETLVKQGYLIKPLYINGESVTFQSSKVKTVFRLGGGNPHHLEITT